MGAGTAGSILLFLAVLLVMSAVGVGVNSKRKQLAETPAPGRRRIIDVRQTISAYKS
jgi:hypothetical protein